MKLSSTGWIGYKDTWERDKEMWQASAAFQTASARLMSFSQQTSSRLEFEGPSLVGSSEIDELLPTSVRKGDLLKSMYQQILLLSALNSHLSVRLTVLQDAPKFRNANGLKWWI